jgi:glycosyltransferase involved in cell wall biosynthesis
MKKHILFIVENNPVPKDLRVWNEALAAKEFGYDVSIICPRSRKEQKKKERLEGIDIYRHYMPLEAASKYGFLLEYGNAISLELLLSIVIYIKKPFHYIHSANPPDHVFLIALLYKLVGVKYIFDHHDLSPESYIAKFGRKDLFYRLLMLLEKLTFKTADIVISTNESYKRIALTRGKMRPENVFVVRNGPNLSKIDFMKPNKKLKGQFKYMVVYIGIIGNQEGMEVLIDAIDLIVNERKIREVEFVIIGTGTHWKNLVALSKEKSLDKYINFTGFIPYKDFYEYLATADLCVNPEYKNEFTDRSTMLKIMDYMTFGKPIIQFETTEGKVTAGEAAAYIQNNDTEEFADTIISLLKDENRRQKMGQIGKERIRTKLNWDIQKLNLKKAYNYLEGRVNS